MADGVPLAKNEQKIGEIPPIIAVLSCRGSEENILFIKVSIVGNLCQGPTGGGRDRRQAQLFQGLLP